MSAPKASNRGQSAQPNGQGFAAALREVGLPEHAIPLALAFFNVGVELGQLLFIGAVFGLL